MSYDRLFEAVYITQELRHSHAAREERTDVSTIGTFDAVAAYLEKLFLCHRSAIGSSIAPTSSEQAFVQSATNQQAAFRNLYDQQN